LFYLQIAILSQWLGRVPVNHVEDGDDDAPYRMTIGK